MVINTYNFWSTSQGPITKSSNPTGVHVLTVLWSHTPPAHTCTHCSCGWQTPHPLFGEGRLPHFSPLSHGWELSSPVCAPVVPNTLPAHTGTGEKVPVAPGTPVWPVPCAAPCCQPLAGHGARGRLLHHGAAATPGFLPFHYYFSCLLCISF